MKKLFLLFLFFTLNIYGQDQICSEGQNMMVIQIGSLPSATAILRGGNEITIEYSNGKKKIKMLDYVEQNSFSKTTIDSTIIDIRTIDTTLYSNKYKFWQETAVGRTAEALVIGDVNKNGRPELYGHEKPYSQNLDYYPVIFELDINNIFKKVYKFPDSVGHPYAIIDLENDGESEIATYSGSHGIICKKPSPNSFATTYYTRFGRSGNESPRDPLFDYFDNNDKMDVVYLAEGKAFIDEFNPITQSFDSVFTYKPTPSDLAYGNIVKGDFDMDGKTDIAFATTKGNAYIVEAEGEHQYQVVWQSKVQTYNAYLNFNTNDIDGNGKPEFWIGGDAFFSGVGKTRFFCFESDGNNSYHLVARIDMLNIFSFFAGNCFAKDIDKDGKEELFICLDGIVLIFKFSGSQNIRQYSLLFTKRNDMIGQNSVIYGATLYNITGDWKDELVINMGHVNDLGRRDFSRIYTLDLTMGIKQKPIVLPTTTNLYQNYPNPFNSSTIIKYQIPIKSNVILKVYDVLGKEIRELLNKEMSSGEYELVWNGTNNNNAMVESGMYFISMQTSNYRKTIKTILLK